MLLIELKSTSIHLLMALLKTELSYYEINLA